MCNRKVERLKDVVLDRLDEYVKEATDLEGEGYWSHFTPQSLFEDFVEYFHQVHINRKEEHKKLGMWLK